MDGDFDFNAWEALARDDPAEFERRRLATIEETCARMGPKCNRKLIAGTRWRIDMERARAKTPLQCCLRLSSLMWDSVHGLVEKVNEWSSCPREEKSPVLALKVLNVRKSEKREESYDDF